MSEKRYNFPFAIRLFAFCLLYLILVAGCGGGEDRSVIWDDPVKVCSRDPRKSGLMGEPALLGMPDSGVLLAYMSGRSGDSGVFLCRSPDGREWTRPVQITGSGNENRSPTLARDRDGTLHLLWSHRKIEMETDPDGTSPVARAGHSRIMWSSSEDGVEWSSPKIVPVTVRDLDNTDPFLHASGDHVWLVWVCGRGKGKILVSRTVDFGLWTEPVEATPKAGDYQWPCLVEHPGGGYRIFCQSGSEIQTARSADGRNWDEPLAVPITGHPAGHPRAASTPDGILLLFHSPTRIRYSLLTENAAYSGEREINPSYKGMTEGKPGQWTGDLQEQGGAVISLPGGKIGAAFASKIDRRWGIYFLSGRIR